MHTGGDVHVHENSWLGLYGIISAIRFGLAALAGSVMRTLLAAAVTDPLVSSVMKFAGISNFSSAPGVGKILFPAAVVSVLFTIFAYLSAGKIKRVDMTVLVADL